MNRCSQCRHEFCWLCFGDWRGHSACNTFKAAEVKKLETDGAKARALLERYVHFFDRFTAHEGAVAFAKKTLESAHRRSEQLAELKGSGPKAVEFLTDAVGTIMQCRRVLAWTYVYGFFLKALDGSSERALFEGHQQRLEQFTGTLFFPTFFPSH
jgi:ariadne-1